MPAKKSASQVREPVQVYLSEADRTALDRVAAVTGLARAEVLRRGLRRFAAEALAEESPALAFLEDAAATSPGNARSDIAEKHDEFLADAETQSWTTAPSPVKTKRPKR